ncbi:hypothetical protein [Tunturiibacter gelidiferens]|uniref:hypothetical protein n=1 Tax=Tunturiibacter gelidiferens TaxID=3069689 RepID=UPI003D9BE937
MAEDLLRRRCQSAYPSDDKCVFASETMKGEQAYWHSGAFVDSNGNGLVLNPAAFGIPSIQPGQQGVPTCGVSTAGFPSAISKRLASPQVNATSSVRPSRSALTSPSSRSRRLQSAYQLAIPSMSITSPKHVQLGNLQVPYDSTKTNADNLSDQYQALSQGNNQGLGQVTNTIGGPRNIQMSTNRPHPLWQNV